MTKVTLYTKPDCSLCDEALAAIERVRMSHTFELEQVDITRDGELQALYGERVPVVAVNGTPAIELNVSERQFALLLERGTAAAETANDTATTSR